MQGTLRTRPVPAYKTKGTLPQYQWISRLLCFRIRYSKTDVPYL